MVAGGLKPAAARAEWVARWLAAGLALGLPLAALGAQALDRHGPAIEVRARMAEAGGWQPGDLTVAVGEPLHLRLISDDVLHGFAIGHSDEAPVDMEPGKVVATTVTFPEPGTYVYYCTRWCGLGHWRMRGTITVTGESASVPVEPPLYAALGMDLDAPHPAARVPAHRPSAARGAAWAAWAPSGEAARDLYLGTSPAAAWPAVQAALPQTPAGPTEADVWDVVAWIWQRQSSPDDLAAGRDLYRANCAACHGETGAGDGVFAAELAEAPHLGAGHGTQAPANFRDAEQMLGATSAGLQGKIIRGGMGTGMPYWGPILTERQTWALVAYLWSIPFEYEEVR